MSTSQSRPEQPNQSSIPMQNNSESDGDEIRPILGSLDETKQKHVQIVRNFFTKGALLILRRRGDASIKFRHDRSPKVDKWFQIELDETSLFSHELEKWKAYKRVEDPLSPLVLEVFLDKSRVTEKETLSVVSEHGVCDLFGNIQNGSSNEILLERWNIEYIPTIPEPDQDFYHVMPKFYKECIIHFRALYTITSLLPTWKLWNEIENHRALTYPLVIRCRIGSISKDEDDVLSQPVFNGESSPVADQMVFDKIQAPLGSISVQVTYRKECRFFVKSNDGSNASIPFDRANRSLDQEDESQLRQSLRRKRSSSVPGRISASDEPSPRLRSSSFSNLEMDKALWSALANDNSENKPFKGVLSFPGTVLKNAGLSLKTPNLSAVDGINSPISHTSNSLAPGANSHRKHKCPYCETEFTRYHNLKHHLLTHSQEKPWVCQTCQMRFRRLHDLKRHMKLHTAERSHICPKCDRKFARGDALARHSKGHGGCAGRRDSMGSLGGDDDIEGSHMGEVDADSERGRSLPTTPRSPRGSTRRSSAHSRASSGRGTSPASLRNISLAPKEFDSSVPTLRHNYSAPDLQDWSNVQARHSRRYSVSPVPNRLRRSNSLPADETSMFKFLEFLKRSQSINASTELDRNSESKTGEQGIEARPPSLGGLVRTYLSHRRRRSQVFDVSPPLSDDEGGVRLRVQRRRPKARRMF